MKKNEKRKEENLLPFVIKAISIGAIASFYSVQYKKIKVFR